MCRISYYDLIVIVNVDGNILRGDIDALPSPAILETKMEDKNIVSASGKLLHYLRPIVYYT